MTRRLLKLGMVKVGIERPDGPVVDAPLGAGLTVLVIPPAQVKNPRGRYGSAGNKDDRIDPYALSDVVPTDQRRLRRDAAHLRRLLVRRGHLGRVAPHLFTLSDPPSRATTWTGLIRSGEVGDVLVNAVVTIRGAASRSPGSVRSSD